MNHTLKTRILLPLFCLLLSACLGMPETVTPVQGFELERYLGSWYEIARLDHSFERGLDNVTARYAMREDGGVEVVNRGYSAEDGEWEEARGKAYFVNEPSEGYLKVSFFGPFYGAYVIFELDKQDYDYAFVSGPNTSFLWFLSRTPTVPQALIDEFMAEAEQKGFDTDEIILVNQQGNS
ncbi:MAG: lipocalin family protein [Pseudohongiellaceae bacterium]